MLALDGAEPLERAREAVRRGERRAQIVARAEICSGKRGNRRAPRERTRRARRSAAIVTPSRDIDATEHSIMANITQHTELAAARTSRPRARPCTCR